MGTYWTWRFVIPASLEEELSATLWGFGPLGLSSDPEPDASGRVSLLAYFSDPPPEEALRVFDWGPWLARGVELQGEERHAEEDWLASYREAAQPIDIGRRFRIDPGEPDAKPPEIPEGRLLLRIPARTAFGTGSHESTRLMLRWLEELESGDSLKNSSFLKDSTVLDVGTGSGILAFAALALGARRVVGYDFDPEAVLMARAYAQLNGYAPALFAGRPKALTEGPLFDLLLVNILPERICDEYPALLERLRSDGRVISSGNLVEQREALLERYAAWGLSLEGEKTEGEWTSFLLRKG